MGGFCGRSRHGGRMHALILRRDVLVQADAESASGSLDAASISTCPLQSVRRWSGAATTDTRSPPIPIGSIAAPCGSSCAPATGRRGSTSSGSARGSTTRWCSAWPMPGGAQAGFARAVTDRARFAWLSDVFVLEPHRGRGLGVWLVQTVMSHPELAGLGHARHRRRPRPVCPVRVRSGQSRADHGAPQPGVTAWSASGRGVLTAFEGGARGLGRCDSGTQWHKS